ncbi:hypothetical protein EV142_103330 [Flavobacterium circumlabens]|uniref:Uncharacterized protein n=1 Tax=Flavobacterium circumlabens TaxID=2133765 RepID=A0ABY2B001_9FLAO|nr:hypothetical protein EV142_103330 [Flavobacterium circumlabens]
MENILFKINCYTLQKGIAIKAIACYQSIQYYLGIVFPL